MGGGSTYSVLFQWRPAFSALWRRGNSVVSVHHINNFWNTRSNLTKFSGQSPQWLRMVCSKLHVKRLRIDWYINEKRSSDVVTVGYRFSYWIKEWPREQRPYCLLPRQKETDKQDFITIYYAYINIHVLVISWVTRGENAVYTFLLTLPGAYKTCY